MYAARTTKLVLRREPLDLTLLRPAVADPNRSGPVAHGAQRPGRQRYHSCQQGRAAGPVRRTQPHCAGCSGRHR